MKIDVKVKNLGKLVKGEIKIRPITVLAGPNGTGKSFFTKTLYSILNVINKNVYHQSISEDIREIIFLLKSYSTILVSEEDKSQIESFEHKLNDLQEKLNFATKLKVEAYLEFAQSCAVEIGSLHLALASCMIDIMQKEDSLERLRVSVVTRLSWLKGNLEKSIDSYNNALFKNFRNEMQENFQVTDLSDLVSFGKDKLEIDINEVLNIQFEQRGINFELYEKGINEISALSRVVFFESPAYWKVSDALKLAKNNVNQTTYLREESNALLTGVPKYFYDLDDALKAKVTETASEEMIELANSIKAELGGEFVFNGDNLVYKESKIGREISKNLISFGMTNLGMIHALLKNNVITAGSFIFIDEPETNLHPDWQVLLMNVLIRLAELEVNVVIATHSIDMLKALEVGIQQRKETLDDDFMAIHFLDIDGQLLEFDSEKPFEQLQEARSALSSAYTSLYFDGCALD